MLVCCPPIEWRNSSVWGFMHDKRWLGHAKVVQPGPGQGYQLHILGKILPRDKFDPHDENLMKLSPLMTREETGILCHS